MTKQEMDEILARMRTWKRFSHSRTTGSRGEQEVRELRKLLIRPKGRDMQALLAAIHDVLGVRITSTSFDLLDVPPGRDIDYSDAQALRELVPDMRFVEVKTTARELDDDFFDFFFSMPWSEIDAARKLKERYLILCYNCLKGNSMLLDFKQLLGRIRSANVCCSMQI